MDAYDVFIEPTAITQCVGCNFISPTVKHLVVGKATLLQIFETVKVKVAKSADYKLKLVAQFKLQGQITDIKPVRTVENLKLDYLLVSTKTAKVSCIRWDSYKHTIQTVSLHYYEHALQNMTYEDLSNSVLVADPNASTAFCLRQKNLIVFLPFNQLDEDDDDDEMHDVKDLEDVKVEEVTDDIKDETKKEAESNGTVAPSNIPLFGSSFILEASALDKSIGEVIDLQFLHNYREPTIAVISQQKRTWAGLLPKTNDNVMFTVLSLDLESHSATSVLKIENLPYDIDRLIPLPLPMNGSLLVGCNEIIHVDSGGITRRVALNEYTASITASIKNYVDQTLLSLKLEGCSISAIPNDNKLLMVLRTGELYFVTFEMDGKTVKRMSVEEIDKSTYPDIHIENPGEIAALDHNLLVISGQSSNSPLVEIRYKDQTTEEKSSTPDAMEVDGTKNDDDDFYDDDEAVEEKTLHSGAIEFVRHDEIINNGPISSFTMAHYSTEKFIANLPNPSYNEVSIFAAGGTGKSGHLNVMTPTVQPIIKSSLSFSQINRLWTLNNKYLITSDDANQKSEIFDINQSYARLPAKHFINDELTVAMHELNEGKFIVQVTPKHIILFDNKFKKVATLEEELKEFENADIINSVFNDEFLMTFFSTGDVAIYTINTYNKSFTKISLPKLLSDTLITTGYITNSRLLNAVLKDVTLLINRGHKRKRDGDAGQPTKSEVKKQMGPKLKTFVLVTGDNRIVVFNRFHNEKCFQLNSVEKFSDTLSLGFFDINGADPDPFIKQVMFNDLGDKYSKEEHMTILTVGGEIYCYKMFFDGANYKFVKEVNQPITGAPFNAYAHGTSIERRMIYFPSISGFTCIMITGVVPYFITRSRHSPVRIFKFSKIPIVSFVPFSDQKLENGLIYLDTKKNARIVEIPKDFLYENNWPMKRIPIGETVKSVAYHEGTNTFVLSTFKEIPYNAIDEEGNPIVGTIPDKPSAIAYKGQIKLLSPINWSVIDTIELADNEVGMSVKSMTLDVGSSTKRYKNKKEFIVVGTGKYRMEDLASNGAYKILDIIDIIPEPGRPETNHKFKEFTQEDTRGAVTSICEVSGRFLVAQGQKVIVRDIKDNTAVSVAFLDTSVYVTESKSFGNLVILGDTLKSIWLAGFDAEPFRMIMLSKDLHGFDVSSADFIVKDEEIFIVVADNNGVLSVLQYNPEDPASSNGQRLLHKSSFQTNYSTTCMKTVPKHEQLNPTADVGVMPFQTVASTVEGAMYTVFPVEEAQYRRMYILQQQLTEKEYHFCGLNPKLNRLAEVSNSTEMNLRPVLDCELIRRFAKLNEDRKKTLSLKIGTKNVLDIWKDLIEMENVLNNM